MATTPTTQDKPMALVEIERLGFGYTEVAQFDLDDLSPTRRIQVRETGHYGKGEKDYAPKDEVQRYAVQMEHSQFPPIIVTRDNWIVDGNTRVGASIVRKQKFFPAIVLDAERTDASEKTRQELTALAATMNSQNGRALTRKEARTAAEALIKLSWKTEQIGRALGVKPGVVTQVRKEIDAVAKLRRVGLDGNGDGNGIREASLRSLGSTNVVGLNDVPFKELAELVRDADLNVGEVTSLAKEMRETGSDQGGIEKVQAQRAELSDRIRQKELTGKGKPPVSRQLRQHLGNVVKYEGHVQDLIETDPNVSSQHLEMIERSIKVLSELLEMQR